MVGKIKKTRQRLKEVIRQKGKVLSEDCLKVDAFLNHKVNPLLMDEIGIAFAKYYSGRDINVVFTAEAAGNNIANSTARKLCKFDNRKVYSLYSKKGKAKTMENIVERKIESPTKEEDTVLTASKDYLEDEKIVIVDDFLFTGKTCKALTEIAEEAGAQVEGYGFVIEKKGFGGRETLEKFGNDIFTLVRIESMNPSTGKINFV